MRHQAIGLEHGVSQGQLAKLVATLAYTLERGRQMEEASAALELAIRLNPEASVLWLHAARVARKLGRREQAAMLYREVRKRSGGAPLLEAMGRVGQALISGDPIHDLGRAIRHALAGGCPEAAAVAQDERARQRRRAGDLRGAIRDYAGACRRYTDVADRGRILHEMADLLIAAGDCNGARVVLTTAAACGREEQRDQARRRLHVLARAAGDMIGARRWRGAACSTTIVFLAPPLRPATGRPLIGARTRELLAQV
jgi:tetratricopeptide (TPR) repeat protein